MQHVREVTAKTYCKRLRILSRLCDLDDVEKMKTLICTRSVSEAMKELYAHAYDYYVKYNGFKWIKPRFTREDEPFFLPLESELDCLISNSRLKMSVFLQLLKETGVDSGEGWKLRWIDIDNQRRTVNITPTKNHNSRTLPISENLLSRLLRLPKKNESVYMQRLGGF